MSSCTFSRMESGDAATRSPARSQFTIVCGAPACSFAVVSVSAMKVARTVRSTPQITPRKTASDYSSGSHLAGESLRRVEADKENAEYQERRKRNTSHQTERTVTAYASFVNHMVPG